MLLSLTPCAASAGEVDVYVSYSSKGMPIFTDAPPDAGGRLVFSYRPSAGTIYSAPTRGGSAAGRAQAASRGPSAAADSVALTDGFAAAHPRRSGHLFPDVLALANQAARRHELDAALIMALIDVESRFRSDALSPAGAMGLMQLMPQTARRFGVADPWDPGANVDAGTKYLRYLLDLFDGDLKLALAGYNAGEANVIAAGRRVPPFDETRRYVPAVLERLRYWTRALKDQRTN